MAQDYWQMLYPDVIEVSRKIATARGSHEDRLRLAIENFSYCLGTAVSALAMVDPSVKDAPFQDVAEQLMRGIVAELPSDQVRKHIPSQN